MLTLITGGIRSGKSRYALELARQSDVSSAKYFLATAEPLDQEMRTRIERHQEERGGEWTTLEEPVYLAQIIRETEKKAGLILADCLTVWINNLLYHFESRPEQIQQEINNFLEVAAAAKTDMIFVTNEVGLGVTPANPLSRRYIDLLGNLNQAAARICDEVIFMVSGIPTSIKTADKTKSTLVPTNKCDSAGM